MRLTSLIVLKPRLLSILSLHLYENPLSQHLCLFLQNSTIFFLSFLKLLNTGIIHLNHHQLLCSAILFILYCLFSEISFLTHIQMTWMVSEKVRVLDTLGLELKIAMSHPM